MDDGVGSLLQNFLKPPLGIVANNQLGIKERIARNADDIEKDQLLPQILENEQFNVTPLEKDMISKVLRLNETKAKDVMTPRAAAFVLDVNEEIGIILDQIIEERYSRIPIYEKDIDNVIGILHIKDLFAQVRKGNLELINIRGLLRESYIVHEYKALDEILLEMQRDRQPFAIVIDEYGGFSGILTLEDILEQIVGDISDEDDEEADEIEEIIPISDTTYKIDGFTAIQDVNEQLNLDLPTDVNETMGGLLLEGLGKLPAQGGDPLGIQIGNVELKAIKINDKRIETLLLRIKKGLFTESDRK